MDYGCCGYASELKLLLQKRNGRFVEVYYRRHACKGHAQEEHYTDYSAACHAVYDIDKVDEHEPRAARIKLSAAGGHGRDDDERRKQCSKGVKKRNISRRAGDALVLAEVRAVDDAAVTGNRQGEKRLTKGKQPKLRVKKSLGVERKNVLISVCRARDSENVHAQSDKQEKQHGHHDLVSLFDAACDTEGHDNKAHDYGNDYPDICAPRRGGRAESTGDGVHVLTHGQEVARERHECIFEYPAHDAGVADGKCQRAEDGYIADALADLALSPAKLGAHTERAHRSGSARSAEGKLADNAGRSDEDNKNEIRNKEGQSAPGRHEHRESPDVAHTDRRAYAGNDKAASAFKAVTALH